MSLLGPNIPKSELKGRSSEQRQVVHYFRASGIIPMFTRMKDDIYDEQVVAKMNALNLKQKAISKIGLDEDELKEIPPVFLHGYNFSDTKAYNRLGTDGKYRSSKYDTVWLFFSNTQVYMYSYTFDMASESKKEVSDEYFYKDVTNFSTFNESIETIELKGCQGNPVARTAESSAFSLVVPGDKFQCSISGVTDADQSISGMKQKLREKKG